MIFFFAPNRDPSDLPHNSYSGTPSRLLSPPNSMSPSLSGLPVFLWRFFWCVFFDYVWKIFLKTKPTCTKKPTYQPWWCKKKIQIPQVAQFQNGWGSLSKGGWNSGSVISKGDAIPAVFSFNFLIAWVSDRNVNCINPLDCQWSKHGFGTDSAGKMPARQKLVPPMSSKSWSR